MSSGARSKADDAAQEVVTEISRSAAGMLKALKATGAGKIHTVFEDLEGEPTFMLLATDESVLIKRVQAVIEAFNMEFK